MATKIESDPISFIRAQAQMRGAQLDERRAQELAADLARLDAAVTGAREKLDFNDEPARFVSLLAASARAPAKSK